MSIELLLDLLVSVLFLAVYHSDLASTESQLEFCMVTGSPDDYDLSGPTIAPVLEWTLDEEPIATPVPDRVVEMFAELLGLPTTCQPVSLTIRPTVKQFRAAAKVLGVKNASRMSKAELERQVCGAMVEASLSELPIGDVTLDLNVDGFSIV
jgi:hypothetical protein